jgi:membrane protease YdiL (CAAX protease family)
MDASDGIRVGSSRRAVFAFVVATLALDGAAALTVRDPTMLQFALAFVPLIVAFACAVAFGGRDGLTGLLRRIAHWRTAPRWYLLALAIPLGATLAIVLLGVLAGTSAQRALAEISARPLLLLLVVFLPALAEEIGWRGFAVQHLARTMSPLVVALVIGVAWTATHLPLYLEGQSLAAVALWPLPLSIMGYSVLITWLYLRSGGSVLVATLFHAVSNAATPLTAGLPPAQAWELRGVVYAALGIGLLLVTRGDLIPRREATPAVEPAPAVA